MNNATHLKMQAKGAELSELAREHLGCTKTDPDTGELLAVVYQREAAWFYDKAVKLAAAKYEREDDPEDDNEQFFRDAYFEYPQEDEDAQRRYK